MIVEEELDEALFFMELLIELNPEIKEKITPIYKEGNKLLSIIVPAIDLGFTRLEIWQIVNRKS